MGRINGKPLEFKAKVRLSPFTGSRFGFYISIEDETSGTIIAEVEIPEDQAARLFGNMQADGKGQLYGCEYVGKKHQIHSLTVPLAEGDARDMERVYAAAEEACNRGLRPEAHWVADRGDFNHHRAKRGGYEVTLRRYV